MVNYAVIIKLSPILSTFILHHFQTKYLSITKTDKQTPNITDYISYSHDIFKQPFPDTKLTPITTKEIKDIIKSLQWKNSQGYDESPLKILKISTPFIVFPLTYMCNKVLSSGIVPMRLEHYQFSPIF